MYLKTENLTLVLIFDKLEHFRCFCRHGRTGATMITVALLLGLEAFFYLISESELNL